MNQYISEFIQDQEDQKKAMHKAYLRLVNLKLSEDHKSIEELEAEELLKIKLERVEMKAKQRTREAYQRTSKAYAEADARGVREAEAHFLATGLAANHPPAPAPVPTATPLIEQRQNPNETQEQRQKRRYQQGVDADLSMPENDYSPMPRGIGKLASKEGITRQAYVQDVKAHINRTYPRNQ